MPCCSGRARRWDGCGDEWLAGGRVEAGGAAVRREPRLSGGGGVTTGVDRRPMIPPRIRSQPVIRDWTVKRSIDWGDRMEGLVTICPSPTMGGQGEICPSLWGRVSVGLTILLWLWKKKENRRVNVQYRTSSWSLLLLLPPTKLTTILSLSLSIDVWCSISRCGAHKYLGVSWLNW